MEKLQPLENWLTWKKNMRSNEKIDADGKFIYPGFIDAHAHFVGYGTRLQTANLVGTNSWDEIIEKLKAFAKNNSDGWLIRPWLGSK